MTLNDAIARLRQLKADLSDSGGLEELYVETPDGPCAVLGIRMREDDDPVDAGKIVAIEVDPSAFAGRGRTRTE